MAGIPLPALAVQGPDPAEMMQAFLGVGRLQQEAAGQLANYKIASQQADIAQKRLAMDQETHRAEMQKAQQDSQNSQAINQAFSDAYKDGKFDTGSFAQALSKYGYLGNPITATQGVVDIADSMNKLKSAEFKTLADKQTMINNVALQAARAPTPELGDQLFMSAINEHGDDNDKKMFMSMTPSQRIQMIQSVAKAQQPIVKLGAGETAFQLSPTGQLTQLGQGQPKIPPVKTGTVNGKLTYAYQTPQGWVDSNTGQPVEGEFVPLEPYAQAVLPTKTIKHLDLDGLEHIYQWDTKNNGYNKNLGVAPSGSVATQIAQAAKIITLRDDLINDIEANRDKIGNLKAILEAAVLGTPLSDPALQGLAGKIGSYLAMQPALHGFRGRDILQEFSKFTGGIMNNVDALIAGIKGVSAASVATLQNAYGGTLPPGVIQQLGAGKGARAPGFFSITAPNGKTYTFKTKAQLDLFKKRAGIE